MFSFFSLATNPISPKPLTNECTVFPTKLKLKLVPNTCAVYIIKSNFLASDILGSLCKRQGRSCSSSMKYGADFE